MEKKFKKTGVYVVEIKDLKEYEKIYTDKKYSYNLYYYNNKKDFEKAEKQNEFQKEFLLSECLDVLPENRKNLKFYDSKKKEYIEYDNFLEKEPKIEGQDKNKFYCIVLDVDVDSLIFFNEEYSQKVYEFNTRKELDNFISGKDCENKLIEQKTSSLLNDKKDNVVYILKKDNKQKVLEYDYILNQEEFKMGKDIDSWNDERFVTKVVFFPSGDTYVFNCHEDTISEAVDNLAKFTEERVSAEDFIKEVKSFFIEEHEFKVKYLGKISEYKVEYICTYDEQIYLINNYIKLSIIWEKEELEYLKNMLSLENKFINDLNDKVKNNPKEAVEKAKELLILMQIIDNNGNILEPYKVIFKDDLNEKTKKQGTVKTKTKKSSK